MKNFQTTGWLQHSEDKPEYDDGCPANLLSKWMGSMAAGLRGGYGLSYPGCSIRHIRFIAEEIEPS